MHRLLLGLAGVIGAHAARAQVAPAAPAVPADAAHAPAFVTIDRFDGSSRVGGELSYNFADHANGADVTAVRIDVHGQYVDPGTGLGGYLQMPFGYASVTSGGQNISLKPVGDLEVGGLFVPCVATPIAAFVLHAGVTLPTASSASDEFAANEIVTGARFTDLFDILPGGVSVRIGGSAILRTGQVYMRFDAGYDDNIRASNNASFPAYLRANVGVGFDADQVAIAGELVNLYNTNGSLGDGKAWLETAAVSLRFHGKAQPYFALLFPIDDDANAFMSAAITFGIDGVISPSGTPSAR
jgi:hypothetical protein